MATRHGANANARGEAPTAFKKHRGPTNLPIQHGFGHMRLPLGTPFSRQARQQFTRNHPRGLNQPVLRLLVAVWSMHRLPNRHSPPLYLIGQSGGSRPRVLYKRESKTYLESKKHALGYVSNLLVCVASFVLLLDLRPVYLRSSTPWRFYLSSLSLYLVCLSTTITPYTPIYYYINPSKSLCLSNL